MTYQRSPESSSDPESLLRLRAVEYARRLCEIARRKDAQNDVTGDEALAGKQVIEMSIPTVEVPVPHYRFALTPVLGRRPLQGINAVYIRVPTSYYYFRQPGAEGGKDRIGTPQWNDTFIELVYGADEPRDYYLLTTSELSKYKNTSQLARNPDYELTGNLFTYAGPPPTKESYQAGRPELTIQLFEDLLLNYYPARQDNQR